MAIKTIVENLDNVHEDLHQHYSETDDGFVLQIDGIREHPEVSKLSRAYQRVKDSEKEARAAIQNLEASAGDLPDDFDLDLWNKAKSGEIEQGLVKVRKELETNLQQERDRSAGLEKRLHSLTIDAALGNALDTANITNPAFRRAATALLKDAVKLDGDKVYVDSDMGPLEPSEYVKKWAASDEGAAFVTPPKGGGAKSGDPNVSGKIKSWGDAKTPQDKVEFLKQQKQ